MKYNGNIYYHQVPERVLSIQFTDIRTMSHGKIWGDKMSMCHSTKDVDQLGWYSSGIGFTP